MTNYELARQRELEIRRARSLELKTVAAQQMATYFQPVNQKEHEKGNAGQDVPDYCQNCNQTFMAHTNGVCPKVGN